MIVTGVGFMKINRTIHLVVEQGVAEGEGKYNLINF
jgi:hypothetical protein